MKKLTSTFAATAHNPRIAARVILAFVASVLVVLLALMGVASGPGGTMAFAQDPSPTETEPPSTDPAIKLINPSNDMPNTTTRPDDTRQAVSDRNDGADELYHIVAVGTNIPSGAIVEAYVTPITPLGVELPEQTIGLMERLTTTPDTWELFWDIPSTLSDGTAKITVRMYSPGAGGTLQQVAEDSVEVVMRHNDSGSVTIELTWPTNGGELGFYKPRGGAWRTIIDGTTSGGNSNKWIFYTVSPPGTDPEWKQCASASGSGSFRLQCTLLDQDRPSQVTAVAGLSSRHTVNVNTREIQSADAHRVRPYAQDPDQMTISLRALSTDDTGGTFRQQVGTTSTGDPHPCIALLATVRDHLDREVQGANVDAHAVGPTDQLQFGDEDIMGFGIFEGGESSAYKTPDRGGHSTEAGENCDRDEEDPDFSHRAQPVEGLQGDHNVPGGADVKHRESVAGSGLDGGSAGFGRYALHLFSPDTGSTDVTVWIDDESISAETDTRAPDSDTIDEGEPSASATLQWLPGAITVRFDPPGDTAQVGTCNRYVVEVRGGAVPVTGANVDVHATGPNNELDFCDPGDGTPRRAPDNVGEDEDHEAEDEGEAHHRGDPPQAQHTEGETDDAGNFVIGITSPITGDTTLQAWFDGERGTDNDTPGSSEPSGRATKSWAASLADAQVSFVNPSAYGGSGTKVSNKPDANQSFHIVTRVDSFETPGVEILISEDDGATFTKIGDASQVGGTDTWEMFWGVNVPDGDYVLRARIEGTDRVEDQDITVNNQSSSTDPRDVAFETLEITRPANGDSVAFTNRETRVEGVTSPGAEGVDLFYTKVAAKDTPQSADWISCGFAQPAADDSFQGACKLAGADQASSVTGIAAITYDCVDSGCNPTPSSTRAPGARDSGDAHRVFGFEGRPRVTLEPAESGAKPGDCQRLVLSVDDETGQPIGGQNVDVHLTGPDGDAHFCTPDTGGSARRAPDQGGHSAGQEDEGVHEGTPDTKHTEGETNSSGRFVFGVTSPVDGDSQLEGWVDQNDDDVRTDEAGVNAVVHWGQTSGGGGRGCTIRGTSGPDELEGTSGDDVICAGAGRDSIRGFGGNDVIYGDRGHDNIRGNRGNDTIYGGRGIDIIRGGAGSDVMRGNGQDDTIRGFSGRDRLIGGGGNDTLRAGAGRDFLKGNAGDDVLDGGRGIDRCRGGRGRDRNIRCER